MVNMDMDNDGGGTSNSQDMSKRQGLIAVNDLNYVLEPDLSVASNKTHKNHYFQSMDYNSNQAAICIINSGADYIDTRRSWLELEVEVKYPDGPGDYVIRSNFSSAENTAATTQGPDTRTNASFGMHGSACNMIESIRISTRSGDELVNLTDFNLMSNILIPLQYGREWVDGPGQLMGFGGGIKNGTPTRFAIPMYILAPLFGYGRLMPAMLMSGMRIEIKWAPAVKAFQSVRLATDPASSTGKVIRPEERVGTYTIKNPKFVLSSIQLSDSIQRALNELSATNGLEIVYTDYATTNYAPTNSLTSINTEIRKSCSRALKAFARVRNVSYNKDRYTLADSFFEPSNAGGEKGIGLEESNDSFRGDRRFSFLEYQWQLGSLYFPQQPVIGNGSSNMCAVSAYAHLLEACDKFHDNAPIFNTFSGIPDGGNLKSYSTRAALLSLTDGEKGTSGFSGQNSTIAVTLERSTMFNLAGVPVNNSRVLALRAKMQSESSERRLDSPFPVEGENIRVLDIFLKYVKLARVFLNNVEVEQ
jgi:hypothetical protein